MLPKKFCIFIAKAEYPDAISMNEYELLFQTFLCV